MSKQGGAGISNGKVVNLAYSLKNSKGDILDKADARDPFVYLHGARQIVPGLETALEGLSIGDKKNVVVAAAEAYGEVDPELKLAVKRTQFPENAKIEAGMQFETHTPDGHSLVFTVDSIEGDTVHIDGNHPLAGQTLHFDVEVLEVREATKEELENGLQGCDCGHGECGHGECGDDEGGCCGGHSHNN